MTGVLTCALPIFSAISRGPQVVVAGDERTVTAVRGRLGGTVETAAPHEPHAGQSSHSSHTGHH